MTDQLTDERLKEIADDTGNWSTADVHDMAEELLELRNEVYNESHRCSCVFDEDKPVTECLYHQKRREEIERLNRMLKCAASDWADMDTDIRKQVSKVLDLSYVYGDTEFIPSIGDLVEELIKENKKLQACYED